MNPDTPAPSSSGRASAALRDRWAVARASRTVRSIGVLVGGTATAHAITALAMPVSSRLYSPEDFSAAAVFAGLVAILSVAACLRFDLAIALPESDEEAADLLALAVLFAVLAASVTAIALLVIPAAWLELLGEPAVVPWLWLVPLGVLVGGAYLALQMWFVRRSGFRAIAVSRIAQSSSAAAAQLGLGFARLTPLGLIVGQLLNSGAGALWLGTSVLLRERAFLRGVSLSGMRRAFTKYRRFPLYSTWEALANACSIYLPILLIAALSTGAEPGYLTLAIFLLQTPMSLLGNAIGQVYLSDAPKALAEGRLDTFTLQSFRTLVRAAAGPLAFLAIASPAAFGLVFGDAWWRAGVLVSWMAPWFFAQFVTSPISTSLHLVGRQRAAMVLQIAGLILRSGGVVAASVSLPSGISEAYAVTGVVFYAAYFVTIAVVLKFRWVDLLRALGNGLPLAALGAIAGGFAWGAIWLLRIA